MATVIPPASMETFTVYGRVSKEEENWGATQKERERKQTNNLVSVESRCLKNDVDDNNCGLAIY